jgi:predicted acetyltransferase
MTQQALSRVELRRPHLSSKDSFLKGLSELTVDSEKYAWVYLGDAADLRSPEQDFEAYVETLLSREHQPPAEFVCDTVYWAHYQGEVVGRISIRHDLNDFLRKAGGHIGYITRPSFRRNGIASEMLRLMLETEKARAIGKLLLTCDAGNAASEKTILKNGGKFECEIDVAPGRPRKKRFWIEL